MLHSHGSKTLKPTYKSIRSNDLKETGAETCDQSHDIQFLLTEETKTVPQC